MLPSETPALITVQPRSTCPNRCADGSRMKSLGADRDQQGRLGKVLIWGTVRARGRRVPRAGGVPSAVRFHACSDHTARWYYICVHLALRPPMWQTRICCRNPCKASHLTWQGASLVGEVNWFAKQPDTWSPVSSQNQIIHLYTPRPLWNLNLGETGAYL